MLKHESFIRQFEENVECLPAFRPEVVFKEFMVWLKGGPLKVCKFLTISTMIQN
jgi:hypothetical protein